MWSWLRLGFSLLLVATAVTKIAAADELLHSGGLLSSPLLIVSVVTFEFVAAAIIGLANPRIAYWFATATFSMFTVIAGASWLIGTDCNCFGTRTTTGLPLLVDLFCLMGLSVSYHSANAMETMKRHELLRCWRAVILLVGGVTILTIGSVIVVGNATKTKRVREMPAWFGENLMDKAFPLLKDPRVAEALSRHTTGVLILLRPDCEHCHQLADQWRREARELRANTALISVSMSPSSWTLMPGKVSETADLSPSAFEIRWDDDKEPVVEAPTLFVVQSGIVVEVHTGLAALAYLLRMSGGS